MESSTHGLGQHTGGLFITFQDVCYSVKTKLSKTKELQLLKGVSGYLQPYQLCALMGPSGSGKTTLLDILAGRAAGQATGEVRFGGSTPSAAFLRRYTGYVEQQDTLIGSLTVQEMLMYTAELKRPLSEPYKGKAAAVDSLLTSLGLSSCRHTRIGDPLTKGISGGQAKRTSIAIALISDVKVLFLDEPTSGLDSASADGVVALLQQLSHSGVTIVATIHSPTAQAYAMFERVLVLVRGGLAYFGPGGDAPLAFASTFWPGVKAGSQEERTAAEYLVQLVNQVDEAGAVEQLHAAYAKSTLCLENAMHLAALQAGTATSSTKSFSARGLLRALTQSKLLRSLSNLNPMRKESSVPGECPLANMESGLSTDTGDHPSNSSNTSATSSDIDTISPSGDSVHFWLSPPSVCTRSLDTSSSNSASSSTSASPTKGVAAGAAGTQQQLATATPAMLGQQPDAHCSSTATPWWWALWVLLKYRARVDYRNPGWIIPRCADKLLFSLIVLSLYLRTGTNYESDNLVNLSGSLFMWVSLPAFGAQAYMPSTLLERRLFYRERADGLYYVGVYLLAKLLEELALTALISTVLSAVVFHSVHYQGSYLLFWVVYFLGLAIGIALGYLVAALSPSMDTASAALPAFMTLMDFLAGQVATFDSMPVFWRWLSKLDFMRYAWTAVMHNQFEHHDPPFASSGKSVLEYYGIKGDDKWTCVSYLVAFFAVFTLLAYLTMSCLQHGRR